MEPKEKAEDLVNQYRIILMDEDTECGNEILCSIIAIRNANITVDEILAECGRWKNTYMGAKRVEYWNEVKQEINKL